LTCEIRSLDERGLRRPPGPEHDTTCAKAAAGLMVAPEQIAAQGMPTPIGLGHEGLAGSALRIPVKKVK
jgi:hypothetical protein